MKNLIYVLLLLFCIPSLAYTKHESSIRAKKYQRKTTFFRQTVGYESLSLDYTSAGVNESSNLTGTMLKSEAGFELYSFFIGNLFYTNSSLSKNGDQQIRFLDSNEFGFMGAFVLTSPLVNLHITAGISYRDADVVLAEETIEVDGYGSNYGAQLHYHTSSSFALSLTYERIDFRRKEQDEETVVLSNSEGNRFAVGVSLWI